MSNTYRVELTNDEWDFLQIVLKEYDMPDLSKSERIDINIIAAKIDLERRTYGGQCDHEYGKIIESRRVCAATLYQPAEYVSTAKCLICSDEVDSEDIQNIID